MLRFSFLLGLAATLAAPAAAQFTLATPDTARVLTVSGTGRAASDADRAILTVAFQTEGATVDDALEKHEREVERVQTLLLEAGIPEGEIKLERVSIGEGGGGGRFEAPRGGSGESAFTASRTLIVRVDQLDLVPSLMAAVVRNEGDDALDVQRRNVDVRYTVRDPNALTDDALRDAVRNARSRADLIAEMSGLTLGDALTVVEAGASPWGAEAAAMMAMRNEMGSGLTEGEYVVLAQVVVTFQIR